MAEERAHDFAMAEARCVMVARSGFKIIRTTAETLLAPGMTHVIGSASSRLFNPCHPSTSAPLFCVFQPLNIKKTWIIGLAKAFRALSSKFVAL